MSLHSPKDPTEQKRLVWRRIIDAILGYDYFISYRWLDGRDYACKLAQDLKQRGFEVFLDSANYASGDNWQHVGAWTLRQTGQLILICTEGAFETAESETPVEREVRIFSQTKRRVIPISFAPADSTGKVNNSRSTIELARSSSKSQIFKYLPREILAIAEASSRLKAGPSTATVETLTRTFDLVRQDKKRVKIFIAISVVLFFLTSLSTILGLMAETSRRTVASQFAANLFAQSQSELDKDPLLAFVIATKAAQAAPESDENLPTYLDRIFHLSRRLPDRTINLPLDEGAASAVFNQQLDRVMFITDNNRAHAFRLPSAAALTVPDYVNKRGVVTFPAFSDDGVSIHMGLKWNHPQPDPDMQGHFVLWADWNTDTGESLTPVDDGTIDVDKLQWSYFETGGEQGEDAEDQGEAAIGEAKPAEEEREFDRGAFYAAHPELTGRELAIVGGQAGEQSVLTASHSGTVMSWQRSPPRFAAEGHQLTTDANWSAAMFVGNALASFGDDGRLSAWDCSTGKMLWTKPSIAAEKIGVSPDKAVIRAGASAFSMAGGKELGKFQFPSDVESVRDTSLVDGIRMIYAWVFDGDVLNFSIGSRRQAAAGSDTETDTETWESKRQPTEFAGFLANGRYALFGAAGSLQICDVLEGTTIATFRIGPQSHVSTEIAAHLFKQTIAVERFEGQVILHLLNGARFTAYPAPTVTSDVILADANQVVHCPDQIQLGLEGLAAISPDGRWLAVSNENRVRVWDTRNGYPLTEWIGVDSLPLALQFTNDNRTLMIACKSGRITDYTIRFLWDRTPKWLNGLGGALTGLSVTDAGEIERLSSEEIVRRREEVLELLLEVDASRPVVRELQSKLEVLWP